MPNLLEVQNVSKSYGAERALSTLSFSLPAGCIAGLLGPNGSGKTTLIKILTGLISDYSGSVKIDGVDVGPKSCALVSYLPDRAHIPGWLKVSEAVTMFADFYQDFDSARARGMLSDMAIPEGKRIKTLSKGMQEKLQLALVMSRRAKLYVLDEPIAAVDPAARDFILETIIKNYNEGSTILLSTHLITDIEPVLDYAIFLKQGELYLAQEAESLRAERGMSVDQLFREVFRC